MSRREGALWMLGLLVAVGVVHALSFSGAGPVDDDFIVYRYARNLIAGDGLVFNVGERFEGFTVPLWLGWIAYGVFRNQTQQRIALPAFMRINLYLLAVIICMTCNAMV